ncbi:hypothetical protein AVEN_138757-1 [Araneus ventricosus]|uniref:Uncharacterized protein n=1 Tax=Araneus ventricosus TaxID=182803 RepID=A0A4Y2FPA4_ARAVE|nr:hypothetical protein AVEN_138757-1 [Araneus ventricosus]
MQQKEERFWTFVCSASWIAGELNAIDNAVTVIISDLLSVGVARPLSAVTFIASELLSVFCLDNLYKCYCSFCLCFVFPGHFSINRHSPLSCLLDCSHRTHTERIS